MVWSVKLSCAGCLILVIAVTFLAVLAGAFIFLSGNIFEEPRFEALDWSPANASTAR
ncbi:MAG: hypothetical protein HW381_1976, partial [Candidatus Rokubacteria bacterium]|nr:hypothetical protein [Candidatus Rokubacteria bacterium]